MIGPDNVTHTVRNLKAWLRERMDGETALRVYNGLRQVRAGIRGKTKRAVTSAHGWRLAE